MKRKTFKNGILSVFTVFLLIAVCFFSFAGCANNPPSGDVPWDNLNGGGVGEDVTQAETKSTEEYSIADDMNTCANDNLVPSGSEYIIDLSKFSSYDVALFDTNGLYSYSSEDKVLTINSSGVFELSGTLNGSVVVNGKKNLSGDSVNTGEVTLLLNGATINSTHASAGILFLKEEGVTKTITVKSGTINNVVVKDESSVIDEKDQEAAIQAKTCNLVINGGGTLVLTADAFGDNYSGIKAKHLFIDQTDLTVNANKNGVNSEFRIYIKNGASLKVNALGDGIKTDVEPSTAEEAEEFAKDIEAGYIYINDSDITVNAGSVNDTESGNHGISANNCLYIENGSDNAINVTTNGGAPSVITEASSDSVKGKALRACGIEFEDSAVLPTEEKDYAAVVITGGKFNLNSCSDAISSEGNLIIEDGELHIASGDDGIHAEYLSKIVKANIEITKCYEGVEGAKVEICGGTLSVKSYDDGINAANGDLKNYSFYILITDGNVYVEAEGDGIDSNGTIKIEGGTVIIDGPTRGDNAALDADTGILVNGGCVIALGAAGMVETPSENSSQCFVNLRLNYTAAANTVVKVENSSGEVLAEHTSAKTFQSAIISATNFKIGCSYKITVGSTAFDVSLESVGTSVGSGGQSGMGPGYKHNPRW